MKKHILIIMLLATTVARAFDFSASVPTGQTLSFNITGSAAVAVTASGDHSIAGRLEIPSQVSHQGVSYAVTAIETRAFQGCAALTSVEVPEGVREIGLMAFFGCTSLDTIGLPSTLTAIGTMAFGNTAAYNNPSRWQHGTLCLGNYLVAARNDLIDTAIDLSQSTLRGISNNAFYTCERLAWIALPASMAFLGDDSFSFCTALDTLLLEASTPPSITATTFEGVGHSIVVSVGCGLASSYRAHTHWSQQDIEERCSPGPEPEGIAQASAEGGLSIGMGHGLITVCGAAGCRFALFDIKGSLIAVHTLGPRPMQIALPRGIYLLRVEGGHTQKVVSY